MARKPKNKPVTIDPLYDDPSEAVMTAREESARADAPTAGAAVELRNGEFVPDTGEGTEWHEVQGRAYFRDKVPDGELGFADHKGDFISSRIFGLEFVRGGVLYSVPWSNVITFARQIYSR